ncbi:sec-independent protein translocase protein TatA [Kribbella orskensis]|uniref:Sec-independent protein translocase protein TatA n=1 Tax=Kribbella orskensis TaxID=2512216 RepID=A0ABY2BVI1_9ACTN|nr:MULTISPECIES: twin-arginine translocase TatA/TatE family subunit [Kribbella]TCN44819.1 sec-independent protein translocase protein TatA [Kribbella sp. VKM Ac-2500]TCO31403.1 sec-independent protein translocase protein TatA [Kribbella orskensis]
MLTLLGMPQGAEWLVILAIVMLLFGSAKLPALVRQLGRSKKIWEEEIGAHSNKTDGELGADARPAQRSTDGQLSAEPRPDHRG